MPAPKSIAVLGARVMGVEYTVTPELPPEVIYAQGFENTPDGWDEGPGTTFSNVFTPAEIAPGSSSGGAINLWRDPVYDYGLASMSNTISGLTIGEVYTFTASMKLYNADAVALGTIGVVGIGEAVAILGSSGWATLTYTFTATAASHDLLVTAQDARGSGDTGSDAFADGMKVVKVGDGSVVYAWARPFTGVSHGTTTPRTGSRHAIYTGGGASGSATVANLTGLTIGWSYTARIWVRRSSGSGSVNFGTAPTTPTVISTSYQERSFTFTAVGTTTSLVLSYATAGAYVIDDFTLTRNTIAAVTVPDLPLDLLTSQITLDDSRSPYVEARLTAHTPVEEYLEQVDPRDGLRVTLEAELSWDEPVGRDPQTRTFDLLLHERVVDHEEGELSLVLESDEALLIDRGNVTASIDRSAFAPTGDVRTIVASVLARHGFTLESGTDTGKIAWNVTNLIGNGSFETATTGWTQGNCTQSRVNTWADNGTWSLQLASPTTNDSYSGATFTTVVGQTYTIAAVARLSAALTGTAHARARAIYVTDGSIQLALSSALPNVAGSARLQATFVATTTTTTIRLYNGHTGGTIWWDSVMVVTGPVISTYFNGATAADGTYTYAWAGTAHASNSTRTAVAAAANVDIFDQAPGVTDWDYLDAVIRQAGLRLFCDELRDWRLVDPATYAVVGQVRVSEGLNATKGTDTISLQATRPDGSPVWYSGVVVRYVWTDALGVTQERYDVAGTSQKVWRVTINRPYPGSGEAAKRLAQAQGRGRTQELEALADLLATPGMALISTMPDTPIQVGTVSAVTWFWAAEGDQHDVMAIRSRGLTDTPVNAWIFAVGAWSAATGTWAGATGSN